MILGFLSMVAFLGLFVLATFLVGRPKRGDHGEPLQTSMPKTKRNGQMAEDCE